ncbi:MAG: type II toxin-antitoxin system MqsA family antitoxin [Acidithiobacillus caldus]|jgi:HTH-type transcriptional regulator/antitoxin MqsA|uniref:HTH cro/C1-type domain-containing protein n=1 Tax=Acidithiobacillus caldus TaxID=33059 RepID=A0A1E7YZQ8_9PROT|nr:type II toxin-antitoxin system MqsA family antitoxin [Acidithiobacillus caldus]MBU2783572.1 type II toxin-antitoxin system MqsA family antitoxin [Acidithiobacillus caldus]MBU2790632.1 type II toxin-antitoxin system MqsA family antitoxin [Acidithiobacillus caldus]MBU2821060.1 type II toxin-antitoxin system MqsA family antitoxin [Acidithiobacillus caldus]OFC62010.1 hypothetical protein BAE30_03230 [Acidithiobacillus caldus]WMT47760.1 MAG: type II toxin-antitoxin system MqsA family antitoxin [
MAESTSVRCPLCGEGSLVLHHEEQTVEYRGTTGNIPYRYKVCTSCGSEQADMDDLRFNRRAMRAFKKSVDGLLTGEEVRRIRERLRITQAKAATLFGGGPVAFSKYESDDIVQSEAMDKLLRLADAFPETVLTFLRQREGIATPREERAWTPVVVEGGRLAGELSREEFTSETPEAWQDAL